jgi:hypothetical protein
MRHFPAMRRLPAMRPFPTAQRLLFLFPYKISPQESRRMTLGYLIGLCPELGCRVSNDTPGGFKLYFEPLWCGGTLSARGAKGYFWEIGGLTRQPLLTKLTP